MLCRNLQHLSFFVTLTVSCNKSQLLPTVLGILFSVAD